MTIRIKREHKTTTFLCMVEEMSDVDLGACFQCQKCACGCPVSATTKSPPSEIIRRLQLGEEEKILTSDIIWACASCETCFARCPMGIDMASVIDALRVLALSKRVGAAKGNVPLFNRAFLQTVKIFGRAYDLAMITAYKIGTRTFTKDTEKFSIMLKKGKIALLPSKGADRKTVKQIFNKSR